MTTKRSKRNYGPQWVPPKAVYDHFSIGKHKLDRLRNEAMKKGVHFIDVNPRSTPRYRYNLEAIKKLLVDFT